jgi:hypothetical protein
VTAPLPPTDINARSIPPVFIQSDAVLCRFHKSGKGPVYFNTDRSGRFNSPDASYGTLYVSARQAGAFAETFLRSPGLNVVTGSEMRNKDYAILRPTRQLRLAQFTGTGLGSYGATAEVPHSGLPYDVSQTWSKALHDHPDHFDGIAYTARHNERELCFALFDRCNADIAISSQRTDLNQPWFWAIAAKYKVGFLP